MPPPPAASSVDSLDVKKAIAILMAMDPNKAADILTGAPQIVRIL
jgi:flagellar motility protein MotE (MotC chaperone)